MKILLAVDGSANSMHAVALLIEHAGWYREPPRVELVTVHLPVPKLPNMGKVVGRREMQRYYEEEGRANLARAAARLKAAGIEFTQRVLVGTIAETIAQHAKAARCDLILIGTRGLTATAGALLGSTATKLLHIAETPVLLVR
jgi:nucleotide-binding universal stress UspA family protein